VRDAAIALEREGFGPVSSTEDLQEGVSAFTEKRKPIFLDGRADVILGFEPLETLRNLKSASEKTLVLMNNEAISPPGLTTKMMNYPSLEEITEKIHGFTKNVVVMEAAKLAEEAGSVLTRNVVLIGGLAATGKMPVKIESLKEAIHELVPAKYVNVNMKAFELGYEYVQKKAKLQAF